jgi:chlorite dismutase
MNPRLVHFIAGDSGQWQISGIRQVSGDSLPPAARLEMTVDEPAGIDQWILRGVTSNERYVTRDEKKMLVAKQEGLGREQAVCAALIPIRKSAAWWALTQDERRQIFEEQSRHTHIGLEYLPAIARRLHHCRDLSSDEPFDFLTWFEFAPKDEAAFDRLVEELRKSPEWKYVEREVDIRLHK